MPTPNHFIFFVDNPTTSAAFYANLLERTPVESSPTFAMFALDSGIKIGLWSKHTVEPATAITGGGGEICFPVADRAAVDTMHTAWKNRGLAILQTPTDMDFGYTFTAQDPDGHRLRVYVLNAA